MCCFAPGGAEFSAGGTGSCPPDEKWGSAKPSSRRNKTVTQRKTGKGQRPWTVFCKGAGLISLAKRRMRRDITACSTCSASRCRIRRSDTLPAVRRSAMVSMAAADISGGIFMPKIMTGQGAVDYIHSYNWLGSRPGLSRTSELLSRLGHPERELRFVHIVGTNGKGSTAAMLESILCEAGQITGLYTSPYLWRFHERIRVNGVEITDAELGEATDYVRRFAEEMEDHPTEFELVTCIALEHYRRRGCGIVVLEAGLGGRLDSTNAIPAPEVAVVTNIGLDHTELLGDTVEKIAAEKGAVIKPGCEAVLYGQTESVEAVIAGLCRTQGVPLTVADFTQLRVREDDRGGQCFDYGDLSGLSICLLGAHQRNNAAVALETVFALRRRGWVIPEEAIRRGLAQAQWPGRFEILGERPWFVVDGGHNPQCAATVYANLEAYFPGEKAVFLIGVLADKDYVGLTQQIAGKASAFVAVSPDSPRALPAEELAGHLARYGLPVTACGSIAEGVAKASMLAGPSGLVCALGSLYMAGAVRAAFDRF